MAAKKVTKKSSAKKKPKRAVQASSRTVKKTTKKVSTKKPVAKKTAKKVSAKKTATKSAPSKKAKSVLPKSAAAETISLEGKKAPSFKLLDQRGSPVTSASLKGQPYVLYFYPKDNTPGCTTESCDFRDEMGNLRKAGVTVLGVSPDSVKSHVGFAEKYSLPFPLLSDPDKVLASSYGVWALKKNYGREYMGIVRSTFLVGADGKVKKEWRGVRVKGHVDAVVEEAKA